MPFGLSAPNWIIGPLVLALVIPLFLISWRSSSSPSVLYPPSTQFTVCVSKSTSNSSHGISGWWKLIYWTRINKNISIMAPFTTYLLKLLITLNNISFNDTYQCWFVLWVKNNYNRDWIIDSLAYKCAFIDCFGYLRHCNHSKTSNIDTLIGLKTIRAFHFVEMWEN